MPKIYYKSNSERKKEAEFANILSIHFSQVQFVNCHFMVDAGYLDRYIYRDQLIGWLKADTFLPCGRRNSCIKILEECPAHIKVCLKPSQISFDFVYVSDGVNYHWELHEDQHRRLKVSREEPIYTSDNLEIRVPRYLQRLIRDVWRVLYFRPLTIVWSDWFFREKNRYQLDLLEGFHEFGFEDNFRFQTFCQME